MFLLRRKSDNKYFVNKRLNNFVYDRTTGNYVRRAPEDNWTDDVLRCIPFKTKSAAMQSRGIEGVPIGTDQCPYPIPSWSTSTPMERDLSMRARTNWYRDREKEMAKRRNELYECVEVEIRIKTSNEGAAA